MIHKCSFSLSLRPRGPRLRRLAGLALLCPLALIVGMQLAGWVPMSGVGFWRGNLAVAEAPEPDAASRPANAPSKSSEPAARAEFRRVHAFLTKYCVDCHRGDQPEADLSIESLTSSGDESLLKQQKSWRNVVDMIETGTMPPDEGEQPLADERDTALRTIRELFEAAARSAKPDPGRVTMRRLNRTEYRNTIRDLVGVDFDPTESFPSDDIGHGFDNIGDVLTLSPVLMERYLAAAESISQRAILPDPPAPPKRQIAARYTEPAGREVATSRFRPIQTGDDKSPIESGPLFTRYKIPANNEYIFRSRVYATGPGPVRAAVLVCGKTITDPASEEQVATLSGKAVEGLRPFKIVEIVEVTADNAEQAQQIEVKIPALDFDRTAIALLKPADANHEITLHVEHLALEGPLDTRPESQRRLLACSPDKPRPEQTREVLGRLARRAYRRPPTDVELQRLTKLTESVEAEGGNWEAGIQLALQAVLCSPKFLFRMELDSRPEDPNIRPLNEFQLASRLSYFLWSTMPDDELFELAAQDKLSEQLEPQVQRMLKDPKANALVENFALQWLQLVRLESFQPDRELFPDFNEQLRQAMLNETRQFFQYILREDRSVLELIDADYTFLNESLAGHYGIIDTAGTRNGQEPVQAGAAKIRGEEFVRVQLTDGHRGGLLTQASILTVTSNPTRTSPVKRGRWVLEQLLGTPPPPPPPNVPELEEGKDAALTGSLRERMEQHRANPNCANCHARMDPIGFALENYDAIGRFRTHDGSFEIDPSAEFPDGQTFAGPAELKRILSEKGKGLGKGRENLFSRCLAEKMLIYALGRGLEYYDQPVVDQIVRNLLENDYKFSALVAEIVKSQPFRFRRGG